MIVVKVGGSLFDWPEFPARLRAYVESRRQERPVLIVGGGPAADWIRQLDRTFGLGAVKAHALAVRSLDLTARVVAEMVPGLEVAERFEDLEPLFTNGRIPVLAPRLPLDDDDRDSDRPLAKSWDVTTDSIAARLAVRLGAGELVLLKSVDAPPDASRDELARLRLVDPAFPEESRSLARVVVVNLRVGSVPVVL